MRSCAQKVRTARLLFPLNRIVVMGIVVAVLFSSGELWAHGGGHGNSNSSNKPKPAATSSQAIKPRRAINTTNLADRPMQPPHGGQITATKNHYFEVVYTPSETRLYVYNASQRGINARRIEGEMHLNVRSSGQTFRLPLTVVAQPAFTGDLGYLAAKVNVTQVRNGDMEVRFDVKNLQAEEPETSFAQYFFITRPLLPVERTKFIAADKQLVARQNTCPVTETHLGDHGEPIKLVVGDQPVYVCCEGCIQRVQNDPYGYIQKVSYMVQANSVARQPSGPSDTRRPHVTRVPLTAADQPLVKQQYMCPVMDEPLGDHGDTIKMMIDGRPLYVCCEGCVEDVEQKPYFYINKLANMRRTTPVAVNHGTHSHDGHNHDGHTDAAPAQVPSRLPTLIRPPAYQGTPAYLGNTGRSPTPTVLVVETTASDAAAIRAQGTCPVTKGSLGSMGTPIKLLIDGKPLFVCCKGCVNKVKSNPSAYSAHVTHKPTLNNGPQPQVGSTSSQRLAVVAIPVAVQARLRRLIATECVAAIPFHQRVIS